MQDKAPPAPLDTESLTIAEVAAILRVSRVTVSHYITDGKLAAQSLGNGPRPHKRITRQALDDFLNSRSPR